MAISTDTHRQSPLGHATFRGFGKKSSVPHRTQDPRWNQGIEHRSKIPERDCQMTARSPLSRMLRNVLTTLPGGERTYAALSAEVRSADKTAIQCCPGKVCFRPLAAVDSCGSECRLPAQSDRCCACYECRLSAGHFAHNVILTTKNNSGAWHALCRKL